MGKSQNIKPYRATGRERYFIRVALTLAEALRRAEYRLTAAGVESAGVEARALLGHLLGLSRTELLLERSRALTAEEETAFEGLLERRTHREPLQHIVGVAPFYGLEVTVTPDALIPRPETERLVELALEILRGVSQPKVLDVGTGSGAVALAIKSERPDAEVVATDISAEALEVAHENAQRLGLEVTFVQADLLEHPTLKAFASLIHVLVSNPPYLLEGDEVSPEVRADPPAALFSGVDGLEHFRRLESQAFDLLPVGAAVLLELDPRNAPTALSSSGRWAQRRLESDLAGRARFLCLVR